MRSFFRQPITWMVTAEVVVVVALAAFAWHEVAGAGSGVAAPLAFPALASPQDTTPQPPDDALTPPAETSAPLLPGLNADPAFWRARLAGLNEAEVQFEALEWRIIHSAMDTASRYVRTVVIPAIEHAERGGGHAR
jgi:hypothetical protein